jgi:hypothetical protein
MLGWRYSAGHAINKTLDWTPVEAIAALITAIAAV